MRERESVEPIEQRLLKCLSCLEVDRITIHRHIDERMSFGFSRAGKPDCLYYVYKSFFDDYFEDCVDEMKWAILFNWKLF